MQSNFLAVLFALASAMTLAWGTVVRHRIASAAPANTEPLKHIPIFTVVKHAKWWAGTGTAFLGYAFQVIALSYGTLLVVQPVLVLSLMFTLPLSAYYDGRRTTAGDLIWSAVLSSAVAVLVVLGKPSPGMVQPPLSLWVPALTIGAIILAVLYRLAFFGSQRVRAVLLGIVTSAIFGYVAVLSKAAVNIAIHQGPVGLLTNWEPFAVIIAATLATAMQQSSFHADALENSLPAMTISGPIVAFILGYLVLGEKFQVSGWEWFWIIASLVSMIVAAMALSRSSASVR
ncbi:DMT family transporter [Corynebacterium freiburgense]|uniref:DMT family transporter n=1 Tax=Corynebacterium freiburgense TaxID=556548 RepID=UPI0004211B36|nr:DMT family transporter [Corynebacterium freiburgense]